MRNHFPRLPATTATVLLAVLASVLPLVVATSAAAAPPVPNAPNFSRAIENYAYYEGNTICDPVDRPGTDKLVRLIKQTYGSDESVGTSRDACYTASEHNDGRAIDWMIDTSDPQQKAKADAFLHWLLATDEYGNKNAMARRLGVMYIIFNRRMWRAYDPGLGWASYSGTNPHTDHIHISLSYDGSTGRSSYWSRNVLQEPCTPTTLSSGSPAVETDPMRYVPLTPVRLASTDTGAGMVNGPCRLFASTSYGSKRVDVRVAGAKTVPSNGVAAVALQVAMRRPNWDSYLTAGPAGGSIPSVRRVSAAENKISSSLMVLPIGADGKVSFYTNVGATDLSVSAVGYYVDPDAPASVRRAISNDGGSQLDPVPARRLYANVALGASGRTKLVVAGKAGTDARSSAAVVSVTVDAGSGHGNLYVYPAGSDRPKGALLSYGTRAQTVQTTVRLGRGGAIVVENAGSNRRSVDVDVAGAYEPATLSGGDAYAARRLPKTVVDTADDTGLRAMGSNTTKDFSVASAVSAKASSVMLQVTARRSSGLSRLSFRRPGTAYGGNVDLSVSKNDVVTGSVVAAVSDHGKVRIRNAGAGLDVRITVVGSFR